MTRRSPRVLRLGLFDARYARNRTTAAALAAAGAVVFDARVPVLDTFADRLGPSRDPWALIRLLSRLTWGQVRLALVAPRRLADADLALFGYPGQWDVPLWAPVARRFGCHVLFDPLGTLTETFVEDRRLLRPGTWRARLLRTLDRRALRAADVVLADTPQQAAHWAALAGVSLERFIVLPVGADDLLFHPSRRSTVSWLEGQNDRLRILFYGTYSPLHGAETIIDAVHRLERAGESVSVVMIGSGQLEPRVRERAAALGLHAVRFIPWVPEAELAGWIAWADVVLGIFGNTAKAARVVPNKVYQAMAMGAAIVTRDSPAMRWLAAGRAIARLVPPADPDALVAAVRELRNPDLRVRLGTGARERYEAVASTNARASSLVPLLRRLTAAPTESERMVTV
ncbi:MAG: glycosyltransferase [Thermomicrobium sp.]|nr:glycosyltransferase [Thermomicrobium sp.]